MERSLIRGCLVCRASSGATQSPMQVGYMVWMINEFGGTAKSGGFRNGMYHTVNWVLVVNVMQVRCSAFAMLINKKNLVVRVETYDAVLGVEMRGKTCANVITNHDRVTNMQISHWCERWFGAAGTGHSNVQSGKGPCALQGFQGDVTRVGTEVTLLDTKQFV